MIDVGSPPQVRVKAILVISSLIRFRITPAGAGKRCHKIELLRMVWDHPRRCG